MEILTQIMVAFTHLFFLLSIKRNWKAEWVFPSTPQWNTKQGSVIEVSVITDIYLRKQDSVTTTSR